MVGAATAAALSVSAPALGADDTATETVVVTGSRIPNRDFSSDSPLSTVSAETLKQTGAIELTDVLSTLPQVVPSFSPGSNNPPSGGEQKVDLRGLGYNRTVVLIDGRRAAPSDSDGTVDLQTIPQSLVSRIEIITGGESAVYGPDAITGVVNFIMKDDFQGVAADAQYGISNKGDDDEKSASVTLGGNFADDKGNVVLSYDYAYRRPIFDGARPFAAQATSATSRSPTSSYNSSSGNRPSQAAVDAYFAPFGAAPGAVPTTSAMGFNDDGSLFNFRGTPGVYNYKSNPAYPANQFCANPAAAATCTTYSFNFQPYNLLIIPLQRQNFMGMGHYDISPDVTAYMSVKFTNYSSDESLAPTPAPTARVFDPNDPNTNTTSGYIVPVNNPFIPADLKTLLNSRIGDSPLAGTGANEDFLIVTRFLALGPRIQINSNSVFQETFGLKGNLPLNLKFDIFASYGQLDAIQTQFGNVSNSAVENLLFGKGSGDCTDNNGFSDFNPFGALKFGPESLACVSRVTKNSVKTTFTNVEGHVTGQLFDLPAGPVAFSLGADYREQTYVFTADPLLSAGDVSGFTPAKSISGAIYDQEAFGELYVPLLKDMDFAKSVSVTLGARITEQANTFHGNAWSEKAEGDWTVFDGFTARGSFEVATRMPNITELFSTSFGSAPELPDPCNVDGPFRNGPHAAQVQALCDAQNNHHKADAGAPDFIQGNSQIGIQATGNAHVHPETADTFTVGAAWTSQFSDPWLSGLSATVDYWNIDLHQPIGANTFGILYGCFNFDGSNPTYSEANPNCAKISRSGGSMYIFTKFDNNQKYQIDGIDLSANWALDLHDTVDADPEWGDLGFNFSGTYLNSYSILYNKTGHSIDFAGTIGATAPTGVSTDSALPRYKGQLTVNWHFFDVASLGVRFTYLDAMKNTLSTVGWTGLPFGIGAVKGTPATIYVDLFGDYAVTDNISLRGGVLNLADKQPPQYNPSEQDGTDPSQYDIIGRRFFVGVGVKL
ncbi:MAG TPA: TonB-dependent receptor [Rhizomicrobium sp.]